MSNSDHIIKSYIQKLLSMQEERQNSTMDEQDMRKIAEDLGMSEEDFAFVQQKRKDYVARGKGYSRYEDWDSAIEEFEQALLLNAYDIEVVYGLANAYKHRWLIKGEKADFSKAKNFAKKALQINPSHDPSFQLASELNKGSAKYPSKNFSFQKNAKPSNNFKNINSSLRELMDTVDTKKFDSGKKRLKRSRRDKKIFGVCGGIAEYFGTDPTWLRVGFIIGAVFGIGSFLLAYLLLAFIMPKN